MNILQFPDPQELRIHSIWQSCAEAVLFHLDLYSIQTLVQNLNTFRSRDIQLDIISILRIPHPIPADDLLSGFMYWKKWGRTLKHLANQVPRTWPLSSQQHQWDLGPNSTNLEEEEPPQNSVPHCQPLQLVQRDIIINVIEGHQYIKESQ